MHNKVVMYYDSTCPICTAEAYHLQEHHADKIRICTVDDGLTELAEFGITKVEAMTYICVKNTKGDIITGMDAVRLLHQTAGNKIAKVLHLPVIKQASNVIYPIFARYRYSVPQWVIVMLFGKKIKNAQVCDNGVCNIPPEKREK